MKKYIMHIGLMVVATIMFSCNKDSFNYKSGYVGTSKVTTYTNDIQLIGPAYVAVQVGGSYTEAGSSVVSGGTTVKVVATGEVNVNVVGVYTLTYTAINHDGVYGASISRNVAVYSTDQSAQSNDFSGDYARSSNQVISTWEKIAPGVYVVSNPGGAGGFEDMKAVVFNPTGYTITMPRQNVGGNPTYSSGETTTPGTTTGTLGQYVWVFHNPSFGTSKRTFNKQ